jgi:hypothetical protein
LTIGLVFLAALAMPMVGCGGDDEPGGATTKQSERTATEKAPPPAPNTKKETATPRTTTTTSPERQPGGAGDEEGNRAQALLTGRGGRITPPVVRVPPYIAIRVELRSADGRTYALRFGGKRIQAGGQIASASSQFAGMRPGKVLVGRPVGGGNGVRIEANAEPGP